jgi:hypothetical protein
MSARARSTPQLDWLESEMTWRKIAEVLDNLRFNRQGHAQLSVHRDVVLWLRRRLPDGGSANAAGTG